MQKRFVSPDHRGGNRRHVFKKRRIHILRRTAIMLASFVTLLTLGATAQENRSDISLQGTGFFTRDSSGNGISRTTSDTGGFQVGYLITSTVGSLRKGIMASAGTLKTILAVSENPESALTCIPSLAI